MTVTNPFAWGLLLLAIPIILFFFLKVRFRKELVTTAFFWQQVLEEHRIRTLFRRFRRFISLLLALLFLTLLTAAVLEPALLSIQNNRCVIIIDNSASMNALLASETRLDFVKRQAAKRIDKLVAGQQAAIITANVNPKILSGFTSHTGTLHQKLAEVTGTDYPADFSSAIHLAEQLLAEQPRAGQQDLPIYIYTDASPIDNLAITRFQPRRLPEHATDYEIFVEVVNFGVETVQTRLEIDCEGEIVDVLPLSLEPNKPVRKIVRNASPEGGLFRAKLASTDSFPTDDTASAFLSKQFVQRVLLFGTDNYFLRNVLQVQPQTEVVLIDTVPDSVPAESVLVCHQIVPPRLPPGNVVVIDPQNGCDLFQVKELLEKPIAATVDAANSLMRFAPSNLSFFGARNIISESDEYKTLAETADNFPLYLQFVAENRRTLVLTADLNQGDFALRTAFPILISQALTYFRNSEALQKTYSTAESVTLTLPTGKFRVGQTQIILRSPSGKDTTFPCTDGVVSLGMLDECGVWTILGMETGKELLQISCNLFNAAASDFRSAIMPERAAVENDVLFVRPIWYYLTLLALLFTSAEWFLYQRRWIE